MLDEAFERQSLRPNLALQCDSFTEAHRALLQRLEANTRLFASAVEASDAAILTASLDGTITRRMRVGNSIGAERVTFTGELGIDTSTPLSGHLPLFQNNESGTLSENKAVASQVEWAAGSRRCIVVGR